MVASIPMVALPSVHSSATAPDDTRGARKTQATVQCEVCAGARVCRVRVDAPGVELWARLDCGDARRWCPRCAQGWVRRLTARGVPADLYSGDECAARWPAPAVIVPPGVDLTSYLHAHHPVVAAADLAVRRERSVDPGAI